MDFGGLFSYYSGLFGPLFFGGAGVIILFVVGFLYKKFGPIIIRISSLLIGTSVFLIGTFFLRLYLHPETLTNVTNDSAYLFLKNKSFIAKVPLGIYGRNKNHLTLVKFYNTDPAPRRVLAPGSKLELTRISILTAPDPDIKEGYFDLTVTSSGTYRGFKLRTRRDIWGQNLPPVMKHSAAGLLYNDVLEEAPPEHDK